MSYFPNHKNTVQRTLYNAGVKAKGIDYARANPNDHEVRKEGVKHLFKKAGQLVVATAVTLGLYHITAEAIDKSPVTQKHKQSEISPPTTTADLGEPVFTPQPGDETLSQAQHLHTAANESTQPHDK